MAQAKVKTKTDYLAFSPIGGGSSWCEDTDILTAISKLEKQVPKDWGHLFAFPDGINIYVYDVTGCDEWRATGEGVFPLHAGEQDDKPLKRIARKVATYFDHKTRKLVKVKKPVLEYDEDGERTKRIRSRLKASGLY